MKKMWMVAAIVCAALMVSCGGEKKAEKKAEAAPAVEAVVPASGQAVEAVVPASGQAVEVDPVVAKAQEVAAKLKTATSEAEAMSITAPYMNYYDSLSEADQQKFDNAVEAALNGAEAEAAPVEAVEPVAATSGATVTEPVVTEPVATNSAVAAQATEIANKMVAAMKSGDEALVEKIAAEGDAYLETLSEADQAVFEEAVAKVAVAAGLM